MWHPSFLIRPASVEVSNYNCSAMPPPAAGLQGRVRRGTLDNGLRSHATACVPPFTSQFGACVRPRTPSSASARRLDWGSGARCGVRDCFDSSSTRG